MNRRYYKLPLAYTAVGGGNYMGYTAKDIDMDELPNILQEAGVAGAGGAGFPSYAKWEQADDVDKLLVNQQESEPNYVMDKFLADTYSGDLTALYDALLDNGMEAVVIGAKEKDRDWYTALEEAADHVYTHADDAHDDLPIDDDESGLIMALTGDRYAFGQEGTLLASVAGIRPGKDELPMDHGWIVQNTETLYNIQSAIDDGTQVTEKHVHVDGEVPDNRHLIASPGTTAEDLLEAAGYDTADGDGILADDHVLLDGGPGWCFTVEDPETYGLTKRTNGLIVAYADIVEERQASDGRVAIRTIDAYDWEHIDEVPPAELDIDEVRIPLITNPDFEGVVTPAEPVVEEGDHVKDGDMVAEPGDGISIAHHTGIDGTVHDIDTDDHYIHITTE